MGTVHTVRVQWMVSTAKLWTLSWCRGGWWICTSQCVLVLLSEKVLFLEHREGSSKDVRGTESGTLAPAVLSAVQTSVRWPSRLGKGPAHDSKENNTFICCGFWFFLFTFKGTVTFLWGRQSQNWCPHLVRMESQLRAEMWGSPGGSSEAL